MTPEFGNLAEIVSVVTETQGRLDTSWALFLSINSGIIGGIVLIERTFNIIEKSVVALVYTVLAALNFLVMHNTINQLHALYKDIKMLEYSPDQAGFNITSYLSGIGGDEFWATPMFIPSIYIVAYILTILCVIFDEKFTFTTK